MIRVENLTKYYGRRLAVDNISFNVERGEIVGFLGPNAAGKTTTMRILTGFLAPTQGEVWVAGYDMSKHSLEARQHIGYFPEAMPLYTDMTVHSYLYFSSKLRGLDENRVKTRIEEVVDICHLEDYIDVILGKLSKGFRQRVGLAQAIIHDPEVVILDEPTSHLDIASQTVLLDALKRFSGTVLFVSHDRQFIEELAEKVIELDHGRATVYNGDYQYFLRKKAEADVRQESTSTRKKTQPEILSPGRYDHEKSKAFRNVLKKIDREETAVLEKIDRLQEEYHKLEALLAEEDVYRDGERMRSIKGKLEQGRHEEQRLFLRWQELEQERKRLESAGTHSILKPDE